MQACNLTTGGAMTELHLPYRPQAVSAHREAIESRRPIFSQLVTLGDDNSLLHMDLMFEPKHWIDRRIVGVLFRIREASFEGIDALGLAMLCLENHYLRNGATASMSQVARLANTDRLNELAEGTTTVNVRTEPTSGHVEVTWHERGVHVDLPAYCMWPTVGLGWMLDLLRTGHCRNPFRQSETAAEAW